MNRNQMEREMGPTILIMDADKNEGRILESYLGLEGYRVCLARNEEEALSVMRVERPNLLILDITIPSVMGWAEFMARYRCQNHTAIILLIFPSSQGLHLPGLAAAADDYLSKPFRPRDLLGSIQSLSRREAQVALPFKVLKAGNVILDQANRCVRIGERYIDLTPSELDLLAALMSTPGRVISRTDLLEMICGVSSVSKARVVDVHINHLRTKIEPNPHFPRYIQTVYGSGYRFTR
jgi:DNA-binding response OmpR family regulator